MAQRNINIGTGPNTKDGDTVRNAFDKVNQNFTELYTLVGQTTDGFIVTDIKGSVFGDDSSALVDAISGNINGNVVTGTSVQGGAIELSGNSISTTDSTAITVDQEVTFNSRVNVSDHLYPTQDNVHDLGAPDKQWRSLYVSGNTIYIAGTPLSIDEQTNQLKVNDIPISQSIVYTDIPNVPTDIADLTDNQGLLNGGGNVNTGDITFAATTISAPNQAEVVVQSKDINGFGTARLTLNSEFGGDARLRAFSSESVDTFTLANGDFATGIWQDNGFGNGVVSFTGAQGIGDFFQNTLFKLTPDNVTITINGGTPFVWNGGANGSGTDTPGFGTNPIVPATPITITSIVFRYRSESFISVNYDNQEIRLNVQNGGMTFDANNTIQMFGDSNIELQSGSDFSINSGQNISIGTSSSDTINISTGDLNITAFDDVNFRGSDSFRLRNTSATAPIRIITDDNNTQKTWAFNPNGSLTFPDATIQTTAFTGEADTLDSVTDRGATTTNNITVGSVITTDITNKLSAATGNIVSSVRFWDSAGANLYVWFDAASTPELVTLGNFGNINGWTVSLSSGNSATITATNPAGYFSISTDVALTGSGTLTFTSPDYAPPAPLPIDINVGANTWTFDNSGNLTLPSGGIIRETEVTGNPTIELEPFNALDPSQKLIIKGGYAEEPHLHLTTGNLVETSIFLGTDEHNVRTKVNGSIEITARDYVNEISQTWAFNDSGSLTFPDATVQTTAYPGPITFLNGDVKGSVFADDSTLLVDAVSGSIPYGVLSGAPSFGNFTFNSNTLSTTTGSLDIAVGNKTYSLVNNTEFSLNYLEIPGYIQGGLQTSFLSSNGLGISIDGSNSPNTVDIGNISSSTVLRVKDGVGAGNIVVQSIGTSLKLQTNNNSTWEFNDTTGLTFPDSTVQTTAYTGPQTTLDGDVTGSVFADNSTLLVDGVNGKIVGEVETSRLRTTDSSIVLGITAGETNQGVNTIAIGAAAGQANQGTSSIAIGGQAGNTAQGVSAVALGAQAGATNQGAIAVSLGTQAGSTNQGLGAVAVGTQAGIISQGNYAVALGYLAGANNQPANSIVINASGSGLDGSAAGFYVNPVRNITGTSILQYNATTGEITHSNEISSEEDISIRINLSDSTQRVWRFGEDGILNLPEGGDIVDSTGTSVLGGGGSGSVLEEPFESKTTATGVVTHDATTNRLFYHTSISANFTANFTNLGLAANEATSISLVLVQGATARMVTAVQIGGAAQTIIWQGSASAPSGNANRTDVVTFSILCTATDTYTVLGMLTSFGG